MTWRARWSITACLFGAGFALGLWLTRGGERASGGGHAATGPASATGPGAARSLGAWDPALGAEPRFAEVTEDCGITFVHENGMTGGYQYLEIMGGGVGLFDYDSDGDLDVYLVNGNKLDGKPSSAITNHLYRNEGGWRFTDVTAQAGVGDAGYGQGCAAGDYDNDGDLDLFVSNYGPDVLYRNNGDGTFTDVTAAAGVGDPGWGQSACFLDSDGDGWLDLYVQNYLSFAPGQQAASVIYVGKTKVLDYPSPIGFRGSASRLYRNNGNGTFRDVTQEAGVLRPNGKGMGVACADLDDDGDVDIFVANDTQENYYFRNRGGGSFEEVGLIAGVAFDGEGVPEASMGVDVGDYDGDGRFDLIVPCLRRQFFTLYRNSGDHFEDVATVSGLARATGDSTGFNANFLDYDNDGDLDLFFTCGGVRRNELVPPEASYNERYGIQDLLVANDGKGGYQDVSARAGEYFRRALIGRGSAAGDLDGDGDLNLVISNLAARAVVLRNDTAAGHWLTVDLAGKGGRRNPPGASIEVEAAGRRQRALVHGRVTYLSQGDRRAHFGLGAAARVDRLEIRWPDGKRQTLVDLPADRVLKIEQE